MDDERLMRARADWSQVEALPATWANQFIVQLGLPAGDSATPDGILIGVGVAMPPVILDEEDQARLAERATIDVTPVIKLALSRERVLELMSALQTTIEQYNSVVQEKAPANHG